MKTAKLVIGIISMVLSVVVLLQSCAAGVVNSIESNGEVSGSAGFMVAVFFIIAGIIGVATRKSEMKTGSLIAAGFYLGVAFFGSILAGNYTDLYIWAFLAWAFGAAYIVDALYTADDTVEAVKWWQKSWFITLIMIAFPPAGIALLWISNKFELAPKIISTVIFSLAFLIMIGSYAGSISAVSSQGTGSSGGTAANATTTTDTAKTTNSKAAPETRVYGPGETWTVDDEFSLTFTSIASTEDRNQFSEKKPGQVVLLTYDYENIGMEKSVQDLYISSGQFKVIDGNGEMASIYPVSTTGNPQPTPIGAKSVGCQSAYGLNNASAEITVNVEVYGNKFKKYKAVFKLPVS